MNNLTRYRVKSSLVSFFNGKLYPIIVGALALVASVLGIEMLLWPIAAVLFFAASALVESARSLIITFVAFCFFISQQHSPSHTVSGIYGDGGTDYYFTEWRLALAVFTVLLIVGGSVFFFVKNKRYKRVSPKRDALFIPALMLSLSFIIGGSFTAGFNESVFLAIGEAAVFSVFYFLFFYGFSESESPEELMMYFSYVSAIISVVIMLQMSILYITSDIIFVDGAINKEGVILGWGIWTLIGISLVMLIPALFYGAVKGGKGGIAYFVIATFTVLFALLSMSRAAQLLGVLTYVGCVAIATFKSKNRFFYRVYLSAIFVLGAALALLIADRIPTLVLSFFDDNGRVEHAKIAIGNFLSAPVFGVGFGGFESITALPESLSPMGPLSAMAHCTPLQLLSATGIFGLFAYILYRVASIVPVLKKRNVHSIFALLCSSVVFVGGLIDNFPFDIYPMFYSIIALAISHKES